MKVIEAIDITNAIADLCIKANTHLSQDVRDKIKQACQTERSSLARDIMDMIENNIDISENEGIPMCQDTGMTCVFVEIGQDVHVTGGGIKEAINEGVRQGYEKGYLRKSIVTDPLRRENSNDNTPAHIVMDIIQGEDVKITVAPKGFGSENMSKVAMLPPSAGVDGIKEFVIETVRTASGNPCPPIVVGVGIGSTFDGVALLAKKALLLPLDKSNEDPFYAELEEELLNNINELDIGPQGFGGVTTALGLRILAAPTHIAGLPVAVNINCHVARHETMVL